jgi:hypothetical protein
MHLADPGCTKKTNCPRNSRSKSRNSCMHPCTPRACCFYVETNLHVLQPHIHMFPCTMACILACPHLSGARSIYMLMEEQIKETMKEETITWSVCVHGKHEGIGTHASFLRNHEETNSCLHCSHGNLEGVPPPGVSWPQHFVLPIVSTMSQQHQSSAIAKLLSDYYTICQHRDLQGFKLFSKAHFEIGCVGVIGRDHPVLKFPLGEQLLHLVQSTSVVVSQE